MRNENNQNESENHVRKYNMLKKVLEIESYACLINAHQLDLYLKHVYLHDPRVIALLINKKMKF